MSGPIDVAELSVSDLVELLGRAEHCARNSGWPHLAHDLEAAADLLRAAPNGAAS